MQSLAPEYIAARRVLLDALDALGDHIGCLVLVGAQAVYHHTGATSLSVPPMTTDADLAIDTDLLAETPEIGGLLRAAHFVPGPNPGHWTTVSDISVDLMVVPHQAGTTKATARAARIDPHERLTARIAHGLEPALVDNQPVPIAALEPTDPRRFDLRVANPAALLVAKSIKIGERLQQSQHQPDRLKQKDALDAFRLLQAIETDDLARGFALHQTNIHAAQASQEALGLLRATASDPQAPLPQLAREAALGDSTVAPSFAALVRELLAHLPAASRR